MRRALFITLALSGFAAPAAADVSIGFGVAVPGMSIGINFGGYPELVPVPGYPVYYAPSIDSNLFFYDGYYWVFVDDRWYASTWYNGPWELVDPEYVPLFVLRVPVGYYRRPPWYFRNWGREAPPRWGDHWGRDWEEHRRGWDRWDRRSVPAPAPLPSYQRQYSGSRYPNADRQQALRNEHYRYQPRDPEIRAHVENPRAQPRGEPRAAPPGTPRGEPRGEPRFRESPSPRPTPDQAPSRGFPAGEHRRMDEPVSRQPPVQRPPAVERPAPDSRTLHEDRGLRMQRPPAQPPERTAPQDAPRGDRGGPRQAPPPILRPAPRDVPREQAARPPANAPALRPEQRPESRAARPDRGDQPRGPQDREHDR